MVLSNVANVVGQIARSDSKSKGPRATALLQLPAKGKPRLIPVCIMIDGKFFDAGIYKADPVPMALENGTVYEAQRTGKPLGLFTVKNVLQQPQTKAWLAEGEWEAAGAAPKKPTALQAESRPREEEDRPPTLRRPAKTTSESKPTENKSSESQPAGSSTSGPGAQSPAPANSPNTASGTNAAASSPASSSSTATASKPSEPSAEGEASDPNAPRLKRGVPPKTAPAPTVSKKPVNAASSKAGARSSTPAPVSAATKPRVELIPAISDAGGPEARPYTYDMKPEEEEAFRKKMLALAGTEVENYVKQFEAEETSKAAERKRATTSKSTPKFEDISLRVFDVATNNEPIIVLTAKAMSAAPQVDKTMSESAREYYVTLVARADYNNELRKLLSTVTDNQHLDVTPRLELIDAVDADGDGRAELLFRENSDAGKAFVVYRVTADRLWALFEGTPY